uniref:Mas-related G-protein coupled receptor member A8 n=1 Tax=Mus musculus TaxID=10090 RepID=MRGA8_MOUSE|nr:mas-related G-protein coupled receptor member A8 [Mus musculus]Q91ZC4.1 RecName: Full=Mas-related G-protein coupled receptor member A8 [Mus musculus]AAI56597.1 MAS-related GPR, member A8 [synthetic construct]AAK91794.1 G protein-coupled receptor [Mus musculus]
MDKTILGSIDIETLIRHLMIIIFGLVGLTGNAIVFWLLGFHLHRNAFLVYILNLALADFFYLLCHIINSIMFLLKVPSPNIILDHCFYTIMIVLYITGLSMLSAISTERCLSVLCPIWYRCHRPEHTSTAMCAVIWVMSLLISILNGYFCNFSSPKYVNNSVCQASDIFIRTYPIFLFVLLCLSTLALLARLFSGAGKRKFTRLFVTIMLAILVFLLCGLPLGFFWFLSPWIEDRFIVLDYRLFFASVVLTVVNSCANPIIYFFVGSFRHRLKQQTLKMFLQRALQDTPETPENMVEMSRSKAEP